MFERAESSDWCQALFGIERAVRLWEEISIPEGKEIVFRRASAPLR
jgi:hypothetical protein